MKIGLIDVDLLNRGKCTFPNLALMKLSAWHKARGDSVEWYRPLASVHMDRVYCSKVFSDEYSPDITFHVDADEVIRGGSGYAISVENGVEQYDKEKDAALPDETEHIMPDYALYEPFGITDTAYGFLTRGCPRGCNFCHIAGMQGRKTRTVSELKEFWNGQRKIVLLDPNLSASADYFRHMETLRDSGATVDFSQGLDARLMTVEKISALNEVRWDRIHFAWHRCDEDMRPHLQRIAENIRQGELNHHVLCYVLVNFGTTIEQDLERIRFLRSMRISPYVMIYRKQSASAELIRLQRWANNPFVQNAVDFDHYDNAMFARERRMIRDASDGQVSMFESYEGDRRSDVLHREGAQLDAEPSMGHNA